MAFYTGERFPHWRGNLFVGALREQMLLRLQLDGLRVVHQEPLLKNAIGRIRDVRSGPDGFIYIVTDSARGVVARLEPLP
jgi:glucose/arabinose dehydrogenase